MTKESILSHLSTIIYPSLNKSIVELKLIHSLKVDSSDILITLAIQNDSVFNEIAHTITTTLQSQFKGKINVERMQEKSKNITYGTFNSPNNRASFAKHVIAVTSGKGGVGKSTVCANLAVGFAQKGYRVAILDADVYGPNVPRLLGVKDEKLQWGNNDKMIPSINYGVKVMSVGMTTPSHDTPLVWRSSVAVSALIQFLEDVEWGELDVLFIDMPPGTGDVQLTMAQEVHLSGGVIVATPQELALDDASRALVMFRDIGVKTLGVVENMSYFIAPDTHHIYDIFGEGGAERLAHTYHVPFLGKIPLTIDIRQTSDQGRPAIVSPEHQQYYTTIVDNLIQQLEFLCS